MKNGVRDTRILGYEHFDAEKFREQRLFSCALSGVRGLCDDG
jgi:hypothetical protein